MRGTSSRHPEQSPLSPIHHPSSPAIQQDELETSCQGMIMGYTSGSAQGYFDELIYRGEQWRNSLTDLQVPLIDLT